MTPDVVVDIGNSRIKWGRCENGLICMNAALPLDSPSAWKAHLAAWNPNRRICWAMAGVNPEVQARFREWIASTDGDLIEIAHYSQVPLRVAVEQPELVGIDRLVTALAAHRLAEGHPAIVVNFGTAVTCDLVDETGAFLGGAIFPGPELMARSLHEFTARLPLIQPRVLNVPETIGRNTQEAIENGIQAAVFGAVDLLVWNISRTIEQKLRVFITGGGRSFGQAIAFRAELDNIQCELFLTLEGIRIAAEALP